MVDGAEAANGEVGTIDDEMEGVNDELKVEKVELGAANDELEAVGDGPEGASDEPGVAIEEVEVEGMNTLGIAKVYHGVPRGLV